MDENIRERVRENDLQRDMGFLDEINQMIIIYQVYYILL